MTTRVERIGDRFGILLTEQQLADLCLRENDPVELRAAGTHLVEVTRTEPRAIEYASTSEALAAYRLTEPKYAEAYRELAK